MDGHPIEFQAFWGKPKILWTISKELKKVGTFKFCCPGNGRQFTTSIIDKLDAIKDELFVVAENGAFCKKAGSRIVTLHLWSNITIIETMEASKNVEGIHPVLMLLKIIAYINGNSTFFLQ